MKNTIEQFTRKVLFTERFVTAGSQTEKVDHGIAKDAPYSCLQQN